MPNTILEGKSIQDPITKYATTIGWEFVETAKAEELRGSIETFFFNEELSNALLKLNSFLTVEDTKQIVRDLERLKPSIQGNKDFLSYIRGERTHFDSNDKRDRNIKLIDLSNPENNSYKVTKEWRYTNGKYSNRADIVFLINGIPVAIFETKSPKDQEGLEKALTQLKRYSVETPELLISNQIINGNQLLDVYYGVTWVFSTKYVMKWKTGADLEEKVKTFFDIPHILSFLNDYIIFAYKDDELIKMILKEHQVEAIEKVIKRAAEKDKTTGLIWHTQGSGKTLTMITAASKLIKDPRFEKPTVILLIDRNELEDQLMKNLESLGITDIYQAQSKKELRDLLKSDTRGLIVSMVHKFEDAPEKLNTRSNIFVLVDEAHRTTSGDLGTYLQAAIPNATFFGFTGTPIDKIHYGQGTFKVFGKDDEQGYLDKYSIAESIKDGTTVPLNYALSPNEFLVPKRILEEEFLSLAETEGINDIEQLNKVLERAVNTKSFLKSRERIAKVTKYVAEHYKNNVEPLGYKAFLVGVDRESCALYKEELDKVLPESYSKVVYTSAHNDNQFLKKYYMSEDEEKKIRKEFPKSDTLPKILIVTEKLLTGFDAPCLYAMYLDKPMRDHTLLQAIARVNRPYEDKQGIKKPYGFVLDFVGIFGNLEKALSFDSDTVKSVITDVDKLKDKFKELIETVGNVYLSSFGNKRVLDDKDIEKIIESFRDEEKRKGFLDFYKEIETLYEILSPDIFLRPYIDSFQALSEIAFVIKNAYTQRVFVEKDFLNKTEALVRDRVTSEIFGKITKTYKINEETLAKIKKESESEDVKVINLIKSIKKHTIDKEDKEKYLISISERADGIREAFEKQQLTTQKTLLALEELVEEVNSAEQMKKDKGFDDQTFFIYSLLKEIFEEYDLMDFEGTAREVNELFIKYPFYASNSKQKRELGADIYALLLKTEENKVKDTNDIFPKVNKFVERLFDLLND